MITAQYATTTRGKRTGQCRTRGGVRRRYAAESRLGSVRVERSTAMGCPVQNGTITSVGRLCVSRAARHALVSSARIDANCFRDAPRARRRQGGAHGSHRRRRAPHERGVIDRRRRGTRLPEHQVHLPPVVLAVKYPVEENVVDPRRERLPRAVGVRHAPLYGVSGRAAGISPARSRSNSARTAPREASNSSRGSAGQIAVRGSSPCRRRGTNTPLVWHPRGCSSRGRFHDRSLAAVNGTPADRGNIVTYLRLNGLVPPSSKPRSPAG